MATEPSLTPPKLKILCFGDSLTAGYSMYGMKFYPYADQLQRVLQEAFPATAIEILVDGMSGAQVREQYSGRLNRACRAATDEPYDWVVILGGTNDLGLGKQPEEIYNALRVYWSLTPDPSILLSVSSLFCPQEVWSIALETGANVLALTVIEAAARNASLIRRRDTLNAIISGHKADRLFHMDLCHAIPYFTMEERKRDLIWDDGLHLKEAGYEMMGDAIGAHLVELLPTLENTKNTQAAQVGNEEIGT
ncbi:hypothetical protein MMC26_004855 [Xylographa opegraphella]|nr:hypothetical protein [Xylographa opegraphella]